MTRACGAKLRSLPQRAAAFIEPMECLAVAKLPERGDDYATIVKSGDDH